ncbi:MAG: HNH endonuclease [Oscillospiraceae bacterium]|nr:HNH endonuclease [Oscillospiraceae bacterium]
MGKLESENFAAIVNSNLARCFVTVDGQALRPDSIFYILGSADWSPDYTHMLGSSGMPDSSPELFKMNLKERLAIGTNGTVVSLRGRALKLTEPVSLKLGDNGEGYRYLSSKRMARVVYTTWFGPIPDGLEVDHLNRKRGDDSIFNLRLVTHSQNAKNRKPTFRCRWNPTDKVLLIPMVSGDPVVVHPSQAYAIIKDCNVWKLLHGQRRVAGGFGAVLNPTKSTVKGHFEAYSEFNREGLLEACLALVA